MALTPRFFAMYAHNTALKVQTKTGTSIELIAQFSLTNTILKRRQRNSRISPREVGIANIRIYALAQG